MLDGLRVVTEVALASPWLLAVIAVLAVVDALLPVVPSEALIIAAGVASATGGQSLLAVIAAAGLGAFIGEVAGYLIGRGIGPGMRTRFSPGGARASAYEKVEGLLARRGGTVLLTARFIPAGRTAATLAAGATAYPPARFLLFAALGAPLSAAYQALLGRVGGAAFAHDTVTALLVSFGLAAAVTLLLEGGRRLSSGRLRSGRADQRAGGGEVEPADGHVDVGGSELQPVLHRHAGVVLGAVQHPRAQVGAVALAPREPLARRQVRTCHDLRGGRSTCAEGDDPLCERTLRPVRLREGPVRATGTGPPGSAGRAGSRVRRR